MGPLRRENCINMRLLPHEMLLSDLMREKRLDADTFIEVVLSLLTGWCVAEASLSSGEHH